MQKLLAAFFLGSLLLPFICLAIPFPDKFEEVADSVGYKLTPLVAVVSVAEQKLYIYEGRKQIFSAVVSTAKSGVGQEELSFKTPLGLHRISKKIGSGLPPHTIFYARKNTGKTWKMGQHSDADLILTRILWLEGLEEGINKGKNHKGVSVDSFKRFIYIHGTNQEDLLGREASHGCIRVGTESLLSLFDMLPQGSLVWIQG